MSHAFETLTNEFVANNFCYPSLLLIIINEFVAFNIKYLSSNLSRFLEIFRCTVGL